MIHPLARILLRRPRLVLLLLFAFTAILASGGIRVRLPDRDDGPPFLQLLNDPMSANPAHDINPQDPPDVRAVVERDRKIYLPVAGGLAFLLLLGAFRCWEGVLPPLAAAAFPLVWVLAVFPLPPGHEDLWNPLLLHLLLASAIGPAVHLLYRYRENLALIHDRPEALGLACRRVLPAATIPLALMGAEFVFIAMSGQPSIRAFGGLGAAGIAGIVVSTFAFLPALLVLSPRIPHRNPLSIPERAARRWTPALLAACRRWKGWILAAFIGVCTGIGIASSTFRPGTLTGCFLAIPPALSAAVHLFEAFRTERAAGRDADAAVARAMEIVGRPALLVGIFQAGGFALLPASEFPGLAAAGLAGAATSLTGLFVGLVVVPAILFMKKPGGR